MKIPPRRTQRGLSTMESLVAATVVAVAASVALPGLATLRASQAVVGAAAEFETDVQHARSRAVAEGLTWRIGFEADEAGPSCYVVHTGSAGACRCLGLDQPSCTGEGRAERVVHFDPRRGGPALGANVRSMAFDPLRGTVTPSGTVRIRTADGRAVHAVVNVMGRVRACSPDRRITGYRAC